MRRLFLLFCFIVSACTQVPEKTIRNQECTRVNSLYVLRVMNNYVLGWIDDEVPYSTQIKYAPTDEHFIFFLKNPGEVYYPKQRLRFNAPRCLIYNGSYTYKKNKDVDKTILIGISQPDRVANPEYLQWRNEQEKAYKEWQEKMKGKEHTCWYKRRNHQKCEKMK